MSINVIGLSTTGMKFSPLSSYIYVFIFSKGAVTLISPSSFKSYEFLVKLRLLSERRSAYVCLFEC